MDSQTLLATVMYDAQMRNQERREELAARFLPTIIQTSGVVDDDPALMRFARIRTIATN